MARPKAPHGTPLRWRSGCHCDDCLNAHNVDTRNRRRTEVVARLDPIKADLIARLSAGESITHAAADLGTTPAAIHGRSTWDQEWADAVDAALTAGRDPNLEHGTPSSYRYGRCRCPDCRHVHESSRPQP